MIGGNGMNEVVEHPERVPAGPYGTFVDGAIALQERSFWYAFGAMNGSVREIQRQTSRRHSGHEASPEEGQRESSTFMERPMNAYFGLLFAPLSFWSRIPPRRVDAPKKAEPEVPAALL